MNRRTLSLTCWSSPSRLKSTKLLTSLTRFSYVSTHHLLIPTPPQDTEKRLRGAAWLADTPLLPLPLLLAQLELLDLACGSLGQITKLHGRRRLEAGDVLLTEVYDLLFCCLLTLLEGDKRLRTLTPLLVWHSDHGGLHHGRVLGEDLLDLHRRDVLTTGDYDVLVAVADLYIAVWMPHPDVLGVEPATLESFLRLLFVVEVAFHNHVAMHDDLAHGLSVTWHIVHLVVHDPYQVCGDVSLTLARQEPRVLFGIQLLPLSTRGGRGERAVGLG